MREKEKFNKSTRQTTILIFFLFHSVIHRIRVLSTSEPFLDFSICRIFDNAAKFTYMIHTSAVDFFFRSWVKRRIDKTSPWPLFSKDDYSFLFLLLKFIAVDLQHVIKVTNEFIRKSKEITKIIIIIIKV